MTDLRFSANFPQILAILDRKIQEREKIIKEAEQEDDLWDIHFKSCPEGVKLRPRLRHDILDPASNFAGKAQVELQTLLDYRATLNICPSCRGKGGEYVLQSDESEDWETCSVCKGQGTAPVNTFTIGTYVRTIHPPVPTTGWTAEAKANRRFGLEGFIVQEHRGHGLCYDVRYLDPGKSGPDSGTFEPQELEVLTSEPKVPRSWGCGGVGTEVCRETPKPTLQDASVGTITTELIRRGYTVNLILPHGAHVRTAKVLNPVANWNHEANRGRIQDVTGVITHYYNHGLSYYVVNFDVQQCNLKSGCFLPHELELLETPKP